jgi:wyosine [tRNA(Phe)-imidazoG37] synthetase (radical SAM superfamily)
MHSGEKRIFGPVPSRRLGFSLGVDLVPFKTCTLDCIYCQLGRTTNKTLERKEYVPCAEVLDELKAVLKKTERVDWVTLSGSGEPTLHSEIGGLITEIKKFIDIPIAVLTNGTLLADPGLRNELREADLVVPSIDAGTEEVFKKINRPHVGLSLERLVKGIEDFTEMFPGRVWLEVMLVKGCNDGTDELKNIAALVRRIRPERVQLNTVVRPGAEKNVRALSSKAMRESKSILEKYLGGIAVEVITDFKGVRGEAAKGDIESAIVTYLKRRPGTLSDLSAFLGLHRNEISKHLGHLHDAHLIREEYLGREKYFVFRT